jgi:hypothetical protein
VIYLVDRVGKEEASQGRMNDEDNKIDGQKEGEAIR